MTSYIVRIYRRDEATGEITGLVESPEFREHLRFQSFAQLRAILSGAVHESNSDELKDLDGLRRDEQ